MVLVHSACLLVLNYLCESRRLRQADTKCTMSSSSLTAKICSLMIVQLLFTQMKLNTRWCAHILPLFIKSGNDWQRVSGRFMSTLWARSFHVLKVRPTFYTTVSRSIYTIYFLGNRFKTIYLSSLDSIVVFRVKSLWSF